jgi:ADP-ribose pyrophosphatase YjhB (NUDIX family)
MAIRNAAKALIVHKGKLLLVKYLSVSGETCYTIPGGGQNAYETLEDAIIRECLEETGYHVSVTEFAALYEEIILDKSFREMHPDYAHKIFHIFLCRLDSELQQDPTEKDAGQTGFEWVDADGAGSLNLYPLALREHIKELILNKAPVFLGTRMLPLPQ